MAGMIIHRGLRHTKYTITLSQRNGWSPVSPLSVCMVNLALSETQGRSSKRCMETSVLSKAERQRQDNYCTSSRAYLEAHSTTGKPMQLQGHKILSILLKSETTTTKIPILAHLSHFLIIVILQHYIF